MFETDGFFEGWNADKVLGFGLEAFNSSTKRKEASAQEAKAKAYATQSQRAAPSPTNRWGSFNPLYVVGGVVVFIVGLLIIKK